MKHIIGGYCVGLVVAFIAAVLAPERLHVNTQELRRQEARAAVVMAGQIIGPLCALAAWCLLP